MNDDLRDEIDQWQRTQVEYWDDVADGLQSEPADERRASAELHEDEPECPAECDPSAWAKGYGVPSSERVEAMRASERAEGRREWAEAMRASDAGAWEEA